MGIHIGKVIRALVKERRIKVAEIADFMCIQESSVYKLYNKQEIYTKDLIKLSLFLRKDLVALMVEDAGISWSKPSSLTIHIRQMEDQEIQVKMLKAVVEHYTMLKAFKTRVMYDIKSRELCLNNVENKYTWTKAS